MRLPDTLHGGVADPGHRGQRARTPLRSCHWHALRGHAHNLGGVNHRLSAAARSITRDGIEPTRSVTFTPAPHLNAVNTQDLTYRLKRKSVDLSPEYMVIDRQVKHLRRLVDDLLDVSRITQGKIALQMEDLDINFVLARAIEAVNPLFAERRHVLSMNFVHERAKVSGDLVRLTQVFVNLLTNAAKYTDPQGMISITTSVGKDRVSVAITDNGSGSLRTFTRGCSRSSSKAVQRLNAPTEVLALVWLW